MNHYEIPIFITCISRPFRETRREVSLVEGETPQQVPYCMALAPRRQQELRLGVGQKCRNDG